MARFDDVSHSSICEATSVWRAFFISASRAFPRGNRRACFRASSAIFRNRSVSVSVCFTRRRLMIIRALQLAQLRERSGGGALTVVSFPAPKRGRFVRSRGASGVLEKWLIGRHTAISCAQPPKNDQTTRWQTSAVTQVVCQEAARTGSHLRPDNARWGKPSPSNQVRMCCLRTS